MVDKLPDFEIEKLIWKNYRFVCGCDEVGRGAFAGPVVAGAVVFEKYYNALDSNIVIKDSKELSPKNRKIASDWIKDNCLSWAVGASTVSEINRLGIAASTNIALRRAIKHANNKFNESIEYLLLDAFYLPYAKNLPAGDKRKRNGNIFNTGSRQYAIVRGDSKSVSIAAASIIAKVYRDDLMEKLGSGKKHFVYKWEKNRGYGTKSHTNAILVHGTTRHHRRKFVDSYLSKV